MVFGIKIDKYVYAGKISKDMILGDTSEIIIDQFNRVIVRTMYIKKDRFIPPHPFYM